MPSRSKLILTSVCIVTAIENATIFVLTLFALTSPDTSGNNIYGDCAHILETTTNTGIWEMLARINATLPPPLSSSSSSSLYYSSCSSSSSSSYYCCFQSSTSTSSSPPVSAPPPPPPSSSLFFCRLCGTLGPHWGCALQVRSAIQGGEKESSSQSSAHTTSIDTRAFMPAGYDTPRSSRLP